MAPAPAERAEAPAVETPIEMAQEAVAELGEALEEEAAATTTSRIGL